MTVGNGRQFLSIPGPTNVPDEVLQAMQRPAMDIYAGEMIAVCSSAQVTRCAPGSAMNRQKDAVAWTSDKTLETMLDEPSRGPVLVRVTL